MPIREYIAVDPKKSCKACRQSFEEMEAVDAAALEACPQCGRPVQRLISAPQVGPSGSGLHDRAKNAGFTTYKKSSQGEYEKKY